MTSSQLAQLSAFRLSKTGLPPLKVQIELSFPHGGPPAESHGESRYSVLVSEAPLQDIAISHLISMLKKLMFSFGSEGFRSALEAIERLGSLKDIVKAGPLQVARPGGCEFLDHRRSSTGDDVTGAKQPGGSANDSKRLAYARRRSESSKAPLRGSTAAELGPSSQSLPLGLFAKDVPRSSSRNRAANMHGGTANGPCVDASLSRSSTRCDGSGAMKQILSVPQPAEAVPDRAKRTVSVRCLAGSSFELEVDSAETGREVAERIAAAVGHPAGLLVLTSGGCVIDQCHLLLHQVQRDEIWYVVRRLGAGLVAMLWEHLLEKKTVSDVAALNETMSLTFGFHFNQSLEGIQLPSSLQSLTFGDRFNNSLEGIQLPSSLQSLTFGWDFNQSMEGIQLPSSLQSLTFGDKFNQSLEGIQLPSSLKSLTFGAYFNQSSFGIQLPSSLQSLTLGDRFNHSLEGIQLPSRLQSLKFGWDFNQSMEGIQLPSSLQSLSFGYKFNQRLKGIQLPSSLQSLTFGDQFNQSFQLPRSLQSLTFGYSFNKSLEGVQLPSSLQSLTFGRDFNQSLDGVQLPSSLQSLTFGDRFNQSLKGIQLPSSLQSLTFGYEFNQSLEGIQLPSSLQSLTLCDKFNQSMEGIQLPSSLKSLTVGAYFNQIFFGIPLPSSLQSLTFGYEFNQSLEGIQLPSSLQSLKFGWMFNQSLEGIPLPSSLQSLTFGSDFNQSLKGIQLPSSLQSLTFGYSFNKSLEGVQLPSRLQSLTFGWDFDQSMEGIQLPSSLQSLSFGHKFDQSLEGIYLPSSLQRGPEADADNFVNDLPLTLAPAVRSSTGPISIALPPTAEPRARQRKDKVDEEEETYTLPSIAELPEMEEATPCSDRTIAASMAVTVGNRRSRCESSRSLEFGMREYLYFQDGEDGEPPNAPYLPGEVWPTPSGCRSPSELPLPASDWLLQIRGEAAKENGEI
eukprot:s32_g17.t1